MIKADFTNYNLIFTVPSGTSRGILTEKPSSIIKVWDDKAPEIIGLGEVSLIPGLSPENTHDVENILNEFIINPELFFNTKDLSSFPAVKFGIETAFLDLQHGGKQVLFPSDFTQGKRGIQINGLIWMADKDVMLKRIEEKVNQGFSCIKIKVGAIDFEQELNLFKYIRSTFSANDLEIRVDANGAFSANEALVKLQALSKFRIHSIEQPIKQGQWDKMAKLCENTPIPIALDEELIGVNNQIDRANLLDTIKPQYIILKPSLIGGLKETKKWSTLAINRNMGWWVTSALEGNIGLNAIAQWTFLNGSKMPQGLGTGKVFSNNIESPLEIQGEQLWYNPNMHWKLDSVGLKYSTPISRSGRGWNISLNNITYDLENVDWNTLKDLNNKAAWWLDIVEFLEQWANASTTIELKTSGSTGEPKIMAVEKAKMWVSATKTCEYFQLNESSIGLLCLSANYIAGKMMLVRAIVSGMNLICLEPSGNPVKDLTVHVDFAAMVPMQIENSLIMVEKLNLISNLIIGGGQVSSTLVTKLHDYSGNAFETFGMTETLSHIAIRQLTPLAQNYFTPFNGVFILHGFNNVLVIDFPELGIYKLKTNDIIDILNTNGAFVWKGRTDFIINSGGIKISPEELEDKIAHLFSKRFCIKGVSDIKLGEKVVLYIEDDFFDTNQLMNEIQKSLPSYHFPKEIRFLKQFPLTATGKIRRKEIL